MKSNMLSDKIAQLKKGKNPRLEAWKLMTPRPLENLDAKTEGLIDAAVLILLYEKNGVIHFPLMLRPKDDHPHSGQISLPGGRCNKNEPPIAAALRETHEEFGVDQQKIKIVHELSPLPISVSGHLVHPFIATYNGIPKFNPDKKEVEAIFEIPLADLKNRERRLVPCFILNEQVVWGATAMILAEMAMLFDLV